jgi:anti-sigma regulatory factor (Ser/Thr protein kinase)/ActR/RegA family two-component response regulator
MDATVQPGPTSAALKNALIVGNDSEVAEALSGILHPGEWKIQQTKGTDEAFALAKTTPFELIVTSRHSSGKEDVEFLRRLRRVRPHTRLIILADESTPSDVIASMRENAFGYLSKSLTMDSLKELVLLAMESPAWNDGIEVVSATPEWIRLHVRCEIATANRLLLFMREIADLPEEERHKVGSAFREMLLNAMEHGGHFDPTQYVEISYVRTKHMVLCRIKDPGQGFSLEEIQHAAIGNPPGDPVHHVPDRNEKGMRPGGYGVLMAKNLVDDLIYGEKGNEVLLIKYLDAPAATKG